MSKEPATYVILEDSHRVVCAVCSQCSSLVRINIWSAQTQYRVLVAGSHLVLQAPQPRRRQKDGRKTYREGIVWYVVQILVKFFSIESETSTESTEREYGQPGNRKPYFGRSWKKKAARRRNPNFTETLGTLNPDETLLDRINVFHWNDATSTETIWWSFSGDQIQ